MNKQYRNFNYGPSLAEQRNQAFAAKQSWLRSISAKHRK